VIPATVPVPAALLARGRWQEEGERGRSWIGSLPAVLGRLLETWNLTPDGPARSGYEGLALPVLQAAERLVLKAGFPDPRNHEALALRAWNGHGAVRLLGESPADGALLLERADAGRTLAGVELGEALETAGALVRVLSVAAPPGLPRTAGILGGARPGLTRRWESLGRPLAAGLLGAVLDLADELAASAPAEDSDVLVNWDLHYGNVLAGVREPWLVIDPKAAAGIPEYGLGPLLWTRLDEMDGPAALARYFRRLTEAAQLDHELARRCVIVQCADYWLWAMNAGLTDDPVRCERIVTTFLA
jgi:streptomycin 6-kinase